MNTEPIFTADDEQYALARDWHGGQASMLYAVASTGGLSRGTIMPMSVDTDEEWNAYLLDALARELVECDMTEYPDDNEVRDRWVDELYDLLNDCAIVGHDWGPVTRSHMAGTLHRPCERIGCRAISLDLDDDDEVTS